MPITLLISVFLLFISQTIFKTFNIGILLLLIISVVGLGLLIVKRKNREYIERCFSIGFIGFLIAYILFVFIDYGRSFSLYDEFQHWGKMIKEMYRLDKFYLAEGNLLLNHHDYPPFVSIFEMLWCKLSLAYSEASATLAMHVLTYSMLVPVLLDRYFKDIERTALKILASISVLFICVFIILMFDMNIPSSFVSIYIDILMPVFYAYGIIVVLDKENIDTPFGFVSLLLIQSALILSKQMSIAFIMLIWLFYTLRMIPGISFKKVIKSLVVLAVPLLILVLWSRYVSQCGYRGQFDLSKISITGLINILRGVGTDAQVYTYYLYRGYLLRENLLNSYVPVSYFFMAVMFETILFILLVHKKNSFHKADFIRTTILYVVGTLGYLLTMYTLYMYCFSEEEMMILASYSRYMSSFTIGEALVILVLIFDSYKFSTKTLCIFMVVLIALTNWNMYRKLKPQRYNEISAENVRNKAIAEEIEKYTSEGDSIVFLSNSEEKDSFFIGYYLDYTKVDTKLSGYAIPSMEEEEYDRWSNVEKRIMANDYVYITETSDVLKLKMSVFTDDEITDDSLYKVEPDGGWAKLIKIY